MSGAHFLNERERERRSFFADERERRCGLFWQIRLRNWADEQSCLLVRHNPLKCASLFTNLPFMVSL